jgi:hypothetical protein
VVCGGRRKEDPKSGHIIMNAIATTVGCNVIGILQKISQKMCFKSSGL